MTWLKAHPTLSSWLASLAIALLYFYGPTLKGSGTNHSQTSGGGPCLRVQPGFVKQTAAKAISFYDMSQKTTYVTTDHNIAISRQEGYSIRFAASFKNAGEKIVAPKNVSFSFWSESRRAAYASGTELLISVDEALIYSGKARPAVQTQQPDGSVTEYVSVDVPYRVFARMAAGGNVALVLGDRYSIFEAVEKETLRNLRQCIERKGCQ